MDEFLKTVVDKRVSQGFGSLWIITEIYTSMNRNMYRSTKTEAWLKQKENQKVMIDYVYAKENEKTEES